MDLEEESYLASQKSDVIGNNTGFHHLRSSVARYEELIQRIAGAWPENEDTEIIEEAEDKIDIEEIDQILGDEA